jgi:hypothetical protein
MVELAWDAQVLREVAAGHRDDVQPGDREDVVQRVHAGEGLDQHDVQHRLVGDLQVFEVRQPPAQRRVRRAVLGTRTIGVAGVPPVATIMAATDSMPMGACSMSIISQSTPVRASAWTSCTLGIETR